MAFRVCLKIRTLHAPSVDAESLPPVMPCMGRGSSGSRCIPGNSDNPGPYLPCEHGAPPTLGRTEDTATVLLVVCVAAAASVAVDRCCLLLATTCQLLRCCDPLALVVEELSKVVVAVELSMVWNHEDPSLVPRFPAEAVLADVPNSERMARH